MLCTDYHLVYRADVDRASVANMQGNTSEEAAVIITRGSVES